MTSAALPHDPHLDEDPVGARSVATLGASWERVHG